MPYFHVYYNKSLIILIKPKFALVIQYMLNLTPQERRVIVFLAAISLLGIGSNFAWKNFSQTKLISGLNDNIGKTNINKADKETLMAIPGIGDKLAQRIIEFRRLNGDFQDCEELKKIKGINSYRFEKIKDSVFVEW